MFPFLLFVPLWMNAAPLYHFQQPIINSGGNNEFNVTLPVAGRRAGPGRSAGRSRWGFSTVAGRSAPPRDSPARCSRVGWDFLPPELCPSGPADSAGGAKDTLNISQDEYSDVYPNECKTFCHYEGTKSQFLHTRRQRNVGKSCRSNLWECAMNLYEPAKQPKI